MLNFRRILKEELFNPLYQLFRAITDCTLIYDNLLNKS
jgi:hypothetical protein